MASNRDAMLSANHITLPLLSQAILLHITPSARSHVIFRYFEADNLSTLNRRLENCLNGYETLCLKLCCLAGQMSIGSLNGQRRNSDNLATFSIKSAPTGSSFSHLFSPFSMESFPFETLLRFNEHCNGLHVFASFPINYVALSHDFPFHRFDNRSLPHHDHSYLPSHLSQPSRARYFATPFYIRIGSQRSTLMHFLPTFCERQTLHPPHSDHLFPAIQSYAKRRILPSDTHASCFFKHFVHTNIPPVDSQSDIDPNLRIPRDDNQLQAIV